METVSITGASGFIGRHLLRFLENNQVVKINCLRSSNQNISNCKIVEGDLLRPDSLEQLLEPGCVVVNLAFLSNRPSEDNLAAMANLADACIRARVKRLIHCSTAVVAGRARVTEVTEGTLCAPENAYEVVKYEIEKLLAEKSKGHFELVILRPTAVFGPGGKNLLKLADDLTHGSRFVNYLKSCLYGDRKMNLVCVDNVTAAISFLIESSQRFDRDIFIISDDEAPANNYREAEKFLMQSLSVDDYAFPRLVLPRFILVMALKLSGKANVNPARIYQSTKLMGAGFEKKVAFESGLKTFSDWYRAGCPPVGVKAP